MERFRRIKRRPLAVVDRWDANVALLLEAEVGVVGLWTLFPFDDDVHTLKYATEIKGR